MRLIAGITMGSLLLCILLSGNAKLIFVLMAAIQTKVFHELRRIRLTSSSIHLERGQVCSDWTLFAVAFICLIDVSWLGSSNMFLCFILYAQWFISWTLFVLNRASTKSSILRQRIAHQSWIHLVLLYTTTQPAIIHWNLTRGGMFWFLFPCFLVICNDSAAYYCGKLFGKTKLIDLSPSKTVEGFVGALFITLLFGYVVSDFLCNFKNLVRDNNQEICKNIRYHGVFMALFASICAPFGGFFASAIKRAAGIKDFAGWIPGHGGLTDRVDCQLFMAVFTYLYFTSIISNST